MTIASLLLLTLAPGTVLADAPTDAPPCAAEGPAYYAFELVTTKRLPGTGLARGRVDVWFPGSSPFVVALAPDGSYEYEVRLSIERAKPAREGHLVAWATTPDLDRVARLGTLDARLTAGGRVAWNKFLVVVTLEPTDDATQTMWTGPIAYRGMSRSGMMHTMVGHGAFQQENCATWGYGT